MNHVVPPELDRRPLTFSFTMLHTYDNICPYQAAQRYVYKNIPFQETEAMRWGNHVHKAMENRIRKGTPLPDNCAKYEPFAAALLPHNPEAEQQLAVDEAGRPSHYFNGNPYLRGKLDINIVNGDTAVLVDFKTGRKREYPFELSVQAVLLHARYPNLKKIVGHYLWLADMQMGQQHDVSDTARTWQRIKQIGASIAHDKKQGVWEKREGKLCDYCPCSDCEHYTGAKA